MPLISVIVPVYNVEPYLRRCADSILAQTFADFELILVDDGSPDNCGAICDEYARTDSRVHVIHQQNGGLSAARNSGIEWAFANSSSEWLSFIDSDDWVHKEYLELLYNAAMSNRTEVSMCWMQYIDSCVKDSEIGEYSQEDLSFEDLFCKETKGLSVVSACAKLYSKRLFASIRFPRNKLNEDLFTTYRVLSKVDRITLISPELYYYYMSDDSIMRKKWDFRRLDEVEGSRELIRFFRSNGKKEAERSAIDRYRRVIGFQISEVESAGTAENKKWYRKLLRAYKGVLLKHMRLFPIHQYRWCYEKAFPISSWLYWSIRGVLGKIRGK